MRILSKIIKASYGTVENREKVVAVDLSTRLLIQYQYNSKTVTHSSFVINDRFYATKHGKNWVSFSHGNFNNKFLYKFKRRYNSTREIDTVSAVRLCHDYNKRVLFKYASKIHHNISDDDVKISFEDIQFLSHDGLEYALPTAITITIADPNGIRSAITDCLINI